MANGLLTAFGNLYSDPRSAALTGVASGLLQAGGPQPYPTSFGQAASRGLLSGFELWSAANEARQRSQLIDAQTRHLAAQTGAIGADTERQRLEREALASFTSSIGGPATPFAAGQAALAAAPQMGAGPGPTVQAGALQEQIMAQPPRPPDFMALASVVGPARATAMMRAYDVQNPPIQYVQGQPTNRYGMLPGPSIPQPGPGQVPMAMRINPQTGQWETAPVAGGMDVYRQQQGIQQQMTPSQAAAETRQRAQMGFETGIDLPPVAPGFAPQAPIGGPVAAREPQPAPIPQPRATTGRDDVLQPNLQVTPKVAAELRAERIKARPALEVALDSLKQLELGAERLAAHPGLGWATGTIGAVPDFPGGPAASFRADLQSLLSKIGFGALQAMRNASKTGGALGQVSNIELQLLQDSIEGLGTAQSAGQMRERLNDVMNRAARMQELTTNAYSTVYRDAPVSAAERAAIVPPGTRIPQGGSLNWSDLTPAAR